LEFLWSSFLLLSPMLLLGLFLSGVIHVFIPRQAILRYFRDEGLKSVTTSAAIGVPMPLCSCSVVPVVAEMRRRRDVNPNRKLLTFAHRKILTSSLRSFPQTWCWGCRTRRSCG
jgi:uncharacterized membrane protein YraQ (UPF0718 family)